MGYETRSRKKKDRKRPHDNTEDYRKEQKEKKKRSSTKSKKATSQSTKKTDAKKKVTQPDTKKQASSTKDTTDPNPVHSNVTGSSAKTDSEKHIDITCEPMGSKPVGDIPAIDPTLAQKLVGQGYSKASQLFGIYLRNRGEQEVYVKSLKGLGIPLKAARKVYEAMNDYSKGFM